MNTLIRLAYRVLHTARLLYWRLVRPDIYGVKVIVFDRDRRVLLVRHSYGLGLFMLPGGGVRRGEDAASAAAREVREETGIAVGPLHLHGRFVDSSRGARNHINVFVGSALHSDIAIDGREIVEARWFASDDLPGNMSRASRLRIDEVREGRAPLSPRWR